MRVMMLVVSLHFHRQVQAINIASSGHLLFRAFALLALLIANTGVTVSEFLGIGAAVQVLANNPQTPLVYIIVPLAGLILWWLVIKGSYRRVEKVFLIMSLGFLAYIPAAFAAHPDWHTVGRELILPSLNTSSGYLLTA